MASKFHKNAILTGYIDSYCLVCESYLKCEDDTNSHIAKPIHKKNLDSTSYLEKYQDDCVRKVKKGYFCEFCNLLLSTATKVGLHVAEPRHSENKLTHVLQREGNTIVAFRDIQINDKAWNGLVDNTCAVCNMEFDNELIHKTESTHILNLIQNKVDFGADQTVYRKIDESFFQCLTCNMVLASSTISTHFNQSGHKELHSKCRLNKLDRNTGTQKVEQDQKPKISLTDELEQNLRQLFKSKKPEAPAAVGKTEKPGSPVHVAKKLDRPPGSFKKGTVDFDEAICEIMEAKDYIAHDVDGKNWCILCDWTMDGVTIDKHVHGNHHQRMLKFHTDRLDNKRDSSKCNSDEEIYSENEEDLSEMVNHDNIFSSLSKFQKNEININFEMCTAVCRKCSKNVDFVCETIEAHIEEHKKKPAKKETKPTPPIALVDVKAPDDAKKLSGPVIMKRRESDDKSDTRASSAASSRETEEEAEKFAKANDLAFRSGGAKVYCRTCDSRIPFSLKNMKEHIAGMSHKNKAAKWVEICRQNITPATVKKPLKDFIKILTGVENGYIKDFVINEKFCINILSFMLISKMNYSFRCEVCEVNLDMDQLESHNTAYNHIRALTETLVIVSMDSEFVRQIRPDVYHCGYCNLVYSDDEDLESHLKTTSHRESKTAANWRLQQYLSEISHDCAKRHMEMTLLVNLLTDRNLFSGEIE